MQTTEPTVLSPAILLPSLTQHRRVFSGEEHTEISIPLDLVFQNGSLNVYETILGKDFFRIQLRKDRLIFQAGGFVGLFPLNDAIAIEVKPRVPIANLERVLLMAQGYQPKTLPDYLLSFRQGNVITPSILDLLATSLLKSVEQICVEGLHYSYQERRTVGSYPRGRLRPFESIRYQARTGNTLSTVSTAFERNYDTAPNQCLRLAIRVLYSNFSTMKTRADAKTLSSRLALADANFSRVTIDPTMRFLRDRNVSDTSTLPSNKLSYSIALPLARVVLANQGVLIRRRDGDIVMPSVLVNMDVVFESYFRSVLTTIAAPDGSQSLSVLDGNQAPPLGCQTPLFDERENKGKINRAAPDFVVFRNKQVEIVIDAKYKISHEPDRSDINQILVYGLVYRSKRVALAYPRRERTHEIIHKVGTVKGIELFTISINLAAESLQEEEFRVVTAIKHLLALDSTAVS